MHKPLSKSLTSSKNTPNNTSPLTPFVRAFLKRVQNTVATHQLWGPQDSFIVAVSGGADSLCLLDVLFLLSQKRPFPLHIAHVNYCLRGEDSNLDEILVQKRAEHYRLNLSVLRPKKTSSANLEEKLRDIRYRFFEKIRLQKKATLIAVAHHQDDQAETFLLRLLRGSGMQGLSAMRPKNELLIRPLIDMSRADILRYLKERGISYRTDTSNTDQRILRNRLRHSLIPLLEKEYQPNIKKILADTATLLAHDYGLLEQNFSLPHKISGYDLVFSARELIHFPEAHLRHQLRLLFRSLYDKKSPPKGVIDECLKLFKSTKNKAQSFTFRGLNIERKGDTVRLLDFYL